MQTSSPEYLATSAVEAAAACGCDTPRIHVLRQFGDASRRHAQEVRQLIRELRAGAEVVDEPIALPTDDGTHVCVRVNATRKPADDGLVSASPVPLVG
jgi:hypothetical protein